MCIICGISLFWHNPPWVTMVPVPLGQPTTTSTNKHQQSVWCSLFLAAPQENKTTLLDESHRHQQGSHYNYSTMLGGWYPSWRRPGSGYLLDFLGMVNSGTWENPVGMQMIRRDFFFSLMAAASEFVCQAVARKAVIEFVVHLAGGLVLIAFYYNFAAFEVYIMSLFWETWLMFVCAVFWTSKTPRSVPIVPEAMIVSIPLYQVKMTFMEFIFSRLFLVLEVDEHHHDNCCKVLVRKLPWFYWLYAETEESEESNAFIDHEAGDALRKGLDSGKKIHASIVVTSENHRQEIQAEPSWKGCVETKYSLWFQIFQCPQAFGECSSLTWSFCRVCLPSNVDVSPDMSQSVCCVFHWYRGVVH